MEQVVNYVPHRIPIYPAVFSNMADNVLVM